MKTSIIALFIAAFLGLISVPSQKTVEYKLGVLCSENPEAPCHDLKDYCREALEKGFECYPFPQN